MEFVPWLVLLATTIIVLRPILVPRKRVGERATGHRADVMAGRNGGHFLGGDSMAAILEEGSAS